MCLFCCSVTICTICSVCADFIFLNYVYFVVFYVSVINLFQVLAHRGSHWTTLQRVCQTLWDHSCRIAVLAQRASQVKPPLPLTAEQLYTTFTPLLVLSTDLIMDMLNRLGVSIIYIYVNM